MDSFNFDIEGVGELDKALEMLDQEGKAKALYPSLMSALTPAHKAAKLYAGQSDKPYKRYMSGGQGEQTYKLTARGVKKGKRKRAKRGEGKYIIQQPGMLRKHIKKRRLTKADARAQNGASAAIYISQPKNAKTQNWPYYWYMVEYGTAHTPAKGFLRRASDENAQRTVEIFKKRLAKRITKLTETS